MCSTVSICFDLSCSVFSSVVIVFHSAIYKIRKFFLSLLQWRFLTPLFESISCIKHIEMHTNIFIYSIHFALCMRSYQWLADWLVKWFNVVRMFVSKMNRQWRYKKKTGSCKKIRRKAGKLINIDLFFLVVSHIQFYRQDYYRRLSDCRHWKTADDSLSYELDVWIRVDRLFFGEISKLITRLRKNNKQLFI